MPRGNPKRPTNLRLDPALVTEVLERTDDLTAAVEGGLRLWLRRARRAGAASGRPNPNRRTRQGDDA